MSVTLLEELKDSKQYGKRRDVVSESSGKTYRVSVRKSDGRWMCSCTGWTNVCNKKGTDCKHIKSVRKKFEGIIGQITAVFDIMRSLAGLRSSDAALSTWNANKTKIEMVGEFLDMSSDDRHGEFTQLVTIAKTHITTLLMA